MNPQGLKLAYTRNHIIRLAAGVICPCCQHEARADDVECADKDYLRFICRNCHCDILTIEPRS